MNKFLHAFVIIAAISGITAGHLVEFNHGVSTIEQQEKPRTETHYGPAF